nr:hypothetical protein OG999_28305 [Streptomyces sp. NBC_00886]
MHAYGAHAARLVAAKEFYDPDHLFTATRLPERRLLEAFTASKRDTSH